jgi:hypothetical protein
MFSLSQVIFLRNWITTGCSLFLWFGLSLATICATTSVASASSVSSDRTAPSHAAELPVALPQADTTEAVAPLQNPETVSLVLAESAVSDKPLTFATLLPDAETTTAATHSMTHRVSNQATIATSLEAMGQTHTAEQALPADRVAQQPVSIPTFATLNECLVECHPSERFNFRPPAQLSLSPVVPRVAQAAEPVYPAAPTVPGSAVSSVPGVAPPAPTPIRAADYDSPLPSTALTPPSLQFQGVYLYQGDESSARARVTGIYPLTPRIQVGGSLDLTDGDVFSEGGDDGVNINELYITLAPQDLPNLRFVVGQLDLTSYFDRNSFAKDSATQFFNPVFATNPALAAAGIGSRQGALVNWTITDNLEARAVVFSSDRSISEFEVNAFAGEVGLRLGNLIVRGTYVSSEDSGSGDGFQEIFNIDRGNGQFGAQEGDRENAYGINAEYFIPEISLGIFGRYGYYENTDLDEGGDAFNFGVNVYDLFMTNDRLGVGYGQALSNAEIRRDNNEDIPTVLEVFYDFRLLPGIRVGVSYQSLNEFSESIAGFRVRGDFNLVPRQTP